MKYLEFLQEIPKLFNWYFILPSLKRIQLNYIVLIAGILFISYCNDQKHRDINIRLYARIDLINSSRSKEQEKYTAKLEYYTDKFNHLLEVLIEQRKEREQINKES
jgi:hypothetical protein